jgi:hypothetical protein
MRGVPLPKLSVYQGANMSNLRRIWTADDDAQLRSLMESGASVGLVAAKLKRTVKAVRPVE